MSSEKENTLTKVAADDVIDTMTDEQLFGEITKWLTPQADALAYMARCWAALERRGHGERLSKLRRGLGRYLPLIAARQLAAEAVVAFGGMECLDHLEGMPLEMQRRLADGEKLPVYVPGEKEPVLLPLKRVPTKILPHVIVNGVIQAPVEQRMTRVAGKPSACPSRTHTVKVDRQTRMLKIGNTHVSIAAVLAALAEAAGVRGKIIDTPENPARAIGGKFTDEELDRFRAAAKAHGLEPWEMVRQATMVWWCL